MHIFLTGEIQVGKSTVIEKTLTLLNVVPGGFRTYFGADRGCPDKTLYMNSVAGPKLFGQENSVARFCEGQPPQVLMDKFNIYGAALIKSARANSSLILMDECGSLERDAFLLQKEIMEALAGSTPVLGVVKLASSGWTDRIRNHPKVKLITVTEENRDDLPQLLSYFFKTFLRNTN